MTPSTTTGTRAAAPPTMKPVSAASSSPPSAASAARSGPVATAFAWRSSACSMTATFRARVMSSMPVPRPVTAAGAWPVARRWARPGSCCRCPSHP